MHFITFIKKYRFEALIFVCVLGLVSTGVFLLMKREGARELEPLAIEPQAEVRKEGVKGPGVFVEVSGSVYKPGVYELGKGSRIYDVLESAGGMNHSADKEFFYRNYNQAEVLKDGEKIHVPSTGEVEKGLFVEEPLLIYRNARVQVTGSAGSGGGGSVVGSGTISINSGSQSELEALPGVGKVTAEKIIQNRPYQSLDELQTKQAISKTLFDKIKDSITL